MRRLHGVVPVLFVAATAGFLATFTHAVEGQGPTEAAAGFTDTPVPGFFQGTEAEQKAAFDLLHDIDTGDGIVQNGGQSTRNKLRTMPLWGTRTRTRHMHDGQSLTFNESILRHGGEATVVILNYRALTATQQNRIITFLKSL